MVRESFSLASEVYTQGGCYRFHLILKRIWPQAVPYYETLDGHVVTMIEGRLYDINGEFPQKPTVHTLEFGLPIGADPMSWQWCPGGRYEV